MQVQLLIFAYLNEDSSNITTFQGGHPTGKHKVNLSLRAYLLCHLQLTEISK